MKVIKINIIWNYETDTSQKYGQFILVWNKNVIDTR